MRDWHVTFDTNPHQTYKQGVFLLLHVILAPALYLLL